MTKTYSNLIDGELITTDAAMEVLNPANEEVIGLVQIGRASCRERV